MGMPKAVASVNVRVTMPSTTVDSRTRFQKSGRRWNAPINSSVARSTAAVPMTSDLRSASSMS